MTTEPNAVERRTFGSLRLRGRVWWLRYRVDGKEHWETSRSSSKRVAEKLLAKREAELGLGVLAAPDVRRVTFADLEALLRASYRAEAHRSLDRAEYALERLRAAFGATRAIAITSDRIARYESDRAEAGASRATINYELALLRRAFNLAIKANRLTSKPSISTPNPRNVRTGFFEPEDFAAVLAELPEWLQPVMQFAYLTGWRVQSEVLPLTWDRVDLAAGVIRLEPNTTKNSEGRTLPFDVLPGLSRLIAAQRELTTAVERREGRIVPFVFHRNGKGIRSYRHGWHSACRRAAGRPGVDGLDVIVRPQLLGRIVHDFRRTAVRNLVRAGVPESVAMKLTGHKTREVFDRYDIVNEADLRHGLAKLAQYMGEASEQAPRGTEGGQRRLRVAD